MGPFIAVTTSFVVGAVAGFMLACYLAARSINKDKLRGVHLDRDAAWMKVGDTLRADEFWFNDTAAWQAWADRVIAEVDERGAWFLVGSNPADDRLVIDVLDVYKGRPDTRLRQMLPRRNVRAVEFWRGRS